jgi:hypothetical protein
MIFMLKPLQCEFLVFAEWPRRFPARRRRDDRLLCLLQQLVQPSFDALMLASPSEIFISVIALSNSDD